MSKEILVDVEHVNGHRTQKDKKRCHPLRSLSDELAEAGAMLDKGSMAEARVETMQQDRERDEVYAALQYAASFHCVVEEWKDCEEFKPKAMAEARAEETMQ